MPIEILSSQLLGSRKGLAGTVLEVSKPWLQGAANWTTWNHESHVNRSDFQREIKYSDLMLNLHLFFLLRQGLAKPLSYPGWSRAYGLPTSASSVQGLQEYTPRLAGNAAFVQTVLPHSLYPSWPPCQSISPPPEPSGALLLLWNQ